MSRPTLESCLLVLSFEDTCALFHYCEYMIEHTVFIELAIKMIMTGLQIYEVYFMEENSKGIETIQF